MLLAAEIVLLVVLLEVGLRLAVPPQVDVPHLRVSAHGFYTWYPGARFTYHNLPGVEPPAAPVRINAHGLRGGPVAAAKAPGTRRVLVLGDSFTAAVQLPEEAIFTSLLAADLNAGTRAGVPYEVLNAGFNGAGTAHELLYFLHRGRALAPDVVILQVSINDLENNLAHGGFSEVDGRLELAAALRDPAPWRAPLLALRDAAGNHSLAFFLLYKAVVRGVGRLTPRAADAAPGAGTGALAPGVALTALLVERVLAAASAIGAPVVVLTIPSPFHLAGGDAAYEQLTTLVAAAVAGTAHRLVVPDAELLALHRAGRDPFLRGDGHLGIAGHRRIAALLAAAVRSTEGAPPAAPARLPSSPSGTYGSANRGARNESVGFRMTTWRDSP